ncbi:MAG TPA: PEGA domain-containing protein [Hyalangium sp.]|nr:PEGA domain-containing protein [Hyalangium sp.]
MRRSWNRVLQAALSGLLAGLLAAGPALAQQPAPQLRPHAASSVAAPKLTVMVVPLDPPAVAQAPRLMYLAEQAVAGAGRFELVRLADALDAQGAAEREAKAREAAAALQEGQKAYDELDTQKALAQFDRAAQLYESSDLSLHFEDMSRARVMKIASYVANGDKKGFQRELKEVLARNPRAEFSPNYFPPDELAVVERTRKSILVDANKTLEVKTGDVLAQIYVDGQFWGTSPQTLQGLTPSEHFVTVIAPGYALAQGKFRGEADLTLQPLPDASRLKAWMDRITQSPEGEDRDAALRELGSSVKTQQVLALVVRGAPGAGPQDAIALRLDVSDGHNLGYATAPMPLGGEAMVTGIQSMLAAVLQTDAPRKRGPTTHYLKSTSGSGRRTAGYVLLGAGAALVAGGVYFGLQANSKSDEFKRTPQTREDLSGELRSDGKTFALLADVGVIAGLVSAGLGSWLAFTGGGEGGKGDARPGRVTAPQPADKAGTASEPQGPPAAKTRAEEERRAREEAKRADEAARRADQERRTLEEYERIKREQDENLKREEEEERRKREAEERRRREEEARRKREEEERRKREEEEKKKRSPLDEDDLRYY